jgi:hypothetical protein
LLEVAEVVEIEVVEVEEVDLDVDVFTSIVVSCTLSNSSRSRWSR